MKLYYRLVSAAILIIAAVVASAEEPLAVRCELNKPDGLFARGEEIRFTLRGIDRSGSGENVRLKCDLFHNGKLRESRTVPFGEEVLFSVVPDAPGWYSVTGSALDSKGKTIPLRSPTSRWNKNVQASIGALADYPEIAPAAKEPEDFDAFWAGQRKLLDGVPLRELERVPVPVPERYQGKVNSWDVKVSCAGPRPVSGYLTIPAGAAPKSLPLLVRCDGAGVRSSFNTYWAQGAITFSFNAHGIPNGQSDEFYRELEKGELARYMFQGRESRDTWYFRTMFLRLMRALDYAKTMPEWNGRDLIIEGNSQGGAQALAGAALEPRVTVCIAAFPALGDQGGASAGRLAGWPRESGDEAAAKTAGYFDTVNFAKRIKGEVHLSAGLSDFVTPPTSIVSIYNSLPSETRKTIRFYPALGHERDCKTAGEELLQTLFRPLAKQAAGGFSATDFFKPECLERYSPANLADRISPPVTRAETEFPEVEKLIRELAGQYPHAATAVSKRLEIARKLKAYVEKHAAAGTREMQIYAWQGAEELDVLLDYFREERTMLNLRRSLPETKELNVRDFGALGDGSADDGPAFRRAFAAALAEPGRPVTVRIPRGDYRIAPPETPAVAHRINNPVPGGETQCSVPPKRSHLLLINPEHLTVTGEPGTRLLFDDPVAQGIRVLGGRNVALKNFTVDYTRLPFTQGVVTGVDPQNGALTVRIDSGYPAPDLPQFLGAPSRRLTPHASDGSYLPTTYRLGKAEAAGNGEFRLFQFPVNGKTPPWPQAITREKVDIIARYDPFEYDAYAVDFRYCAFCSAEGVTIHSSPAGGYRMMQTYACSLIGCRIEVPDGSGRLTSTNADGIQARGPIGPYLYDCHFCQMEDDGVNVNSSTPEVGGVLPDDGAGMLVDLSTGQIRAVTRFQKGNAEFPLPEDIRSTATVKEEKLTHQQKSALGYWSTDSKYKIRPDRIISIPGECNGTVILESSFAKIRGLGVQITAPNALLENCLFEGNSGCSMYINAMLNWGMAFNTHNVTVRNCTFRDLRRDGVSVGYHSLTPGTLAPRQLAGLRFENNRFEQGPTGTALVLGNCSDVVLTDNRFYKTAQGGAPILLDNTSGVAGSGNRFIWPGATEKQMFRFGKFLPRTPPELTNSIFQP